MLSKCDQNLLPRLGLWSCEGDFIEMELVLAVPYSRPFG